MKTTSGPRTRYDRAASTTTSADTATATVVRCAKCDEATYERAKPKGTGAGADGRTDADGRGRSPDAGVDREEGREAPRTELESRESRRNGRTAAGKRGSGSCSSYSTLSALFELQVIGSDGTAFWMMRGTDAHKGNIDRTSGESVIPRNIFLFCILINTLVWCAGLQGG